MSTVNETVEKALAKKVMEQLDLDAMAKKLAPQVQKEILAGVLKGVKGVYWTEIVQEALYSKNSDVEAFILNVLNIPQKPPKKKSR